MLAPSDAFNSTTPPSSAEVKNLLNKFAQHDV